MNEVGVALVNGLAGNPALLLLCVVLVGGGWLSKTVITKVVDGVFSRLDKFDSRLEGIEGSLKEIVTLQRDVEHLTDRVDRVEDVCQRRHEK